MASGPERLSALLGVRIRSVATSGQFSLALSMGGEVYAWGYGGEGQLGQGDESSRAAPTLIEELLHETVACIAVGDDHALAATEGGALYSWGYGIDGRLGLTEAEGRLLPELVSELSGVSVKGVAAGRWHSLARTADGALYSWGGGGFGRLGHGDEASLRLPTRVAALSGVHVVGMAAGAHHTLALSDAGRLYSWGLGGNGRLGHGDTELRLLPTPIAALVQRHVIVTCLAAGAHHSLAVTDQGALLTWGDGGGGRLGRGDINSLVGVYINADCLTPTPVEALRGVCVAAVSAGEEHCLAVTRDGEAYGWGDYGRESTLGVPRHGGGSGGGGGGGGGGGEGGGGGAAGAMRGPLRYEDFTMDLRFRRDAAAF